MKLSINQYEEIFGKSNITDYTKFNWLRYPILQKDKYDNVNSVVYPQQLQGQVVSIRIDRKITEIAEGWTPSENINITFYDTDSQYIKDYNFKPGTEKTIKIPSNSKNAMYIYADAVDSSKVKADLTITIREVLVENLAENMEAIGKPMVEHKGDDYVFISDNSWNKSIRKNLLNSNLAYGNYKFNFNINYGMENKYFYILNSTKGTDIVNSTQINPGGTFQLTPENYTPGDNLVIEILNLSSSESVNSIGNFYVAKIIDD